MKEEIKQTKTMKRQKEMKEENQKDILKTKEMRNSSRLLWDAKLNMGLHRMFINILGENPLFVSQHLKTKKGKMEIERKNKKKERKKLVKFCYRQWVKIMWRIFVALTFNTKSQNLQICTFLQKSEKIICSVE